MTTRSRKLVALLLVALLASQSIVGIGLAASESETSEPTIAEERPEYVNCSYDEDLLSKYQPALETNHLDVKPSSVYASYCTSPEYQDDIAMYFVYYPVQEGASDGWLGDSHQYDREPIYVHIDGETGEVTKATYSAYHYIKGERSADNLRFSDSYGDQSIRMHVVNPHHHYLTGGVNFVDEGTQPPLRDLDEVAQTWQDDGWAAKTETVANPYVMESKSSWWDDDTWDGKLAETWWGIRLTIENLLPWSDANTDLTS